MNTDNKVFMHAIDHYDNVIGGINGWQIVKLSVALIKHSYFLNDYFGMQTSTEMMS